MRQLTGKCISITNTHTYQTQIVIFLLLYLDHPILSRYFVKHNLLVSLHWNSVECITKCACLYARLDIESDLRTYPAYTVVESGAMYSPGNGQYYTSGGGSNSITYSQVNETK